MVPFAAYLPAEELGYHESHGSGVIAVVTAGLLLGHKSQIIQSGQSRLNERVNWGTIQFLLENTVFLLIGLQARRDRGRDGASRRCRAGRSPASALAVLATVIVLRMIWVFLMRISLFRRHARQRRRRRSKVPWQATLVVGWAGLRGVVTLAAVLLIPDNAATHEVLPVLIFAAMVVTFGTLLLQGLTLPPLVRRLAAARPRRPLRRAPGRDGAHHLDDRGAQGAGRPQRGRRTTPRWSSGSATASTPGPNGSGSASATTATARRRPRPTGGCGCRPSRCSATRCSRCGRTAPSTTRSSRRSSTPSTSRSPCSRSPASAPTRSTRPTTRSGRRSTPSGRARTSRPPRPRSSADGDGRCQDCVREGTTPVHLRICLACGNVGCCDSSVGRHADKHFHADEAQGDAQLRARRGLALVLRRRAPRVRSTAPHASDAAPPPARAPVPGRPDERTTRSSSCEEGRKASGQSASTRRSGAETETDTYQGLLLAPLLRYESGQVGAVGLEEPVSREAGGCHGCRAAMTGGAVEDSLAVRAGRMFAAYRDGDGAAMSDLVRTLTPLLWHTVRATRLDTAAAEDVLQTVWLSLVRHGDTIARAERGPAVAGRVDQAGGVARLAGPGPGASRGRRDDAGERERRRAGGRRAGGRGRGRRRPVAPRAAAPGTLPDPAARHRLRGEARLRADRPRPRDAGGQHRPDPRAGAWPSCGSRSPPTRSGVPRERAARPGGGADPARSWPPRRSRSAPTTSPCSNGSARCGSGTTRCPTGLVGRIEFALTLDALETEVATLTQVDLAPSGSRAGETEAVRTVTFTQRDARHDGHADRRPGRHRPRRRLDRPGAPRCGSRSCSTASTPRGRRGRRRTVRPRVGPEGPGQVRPAPAPAVRSSAPRSSSDRRSARCGAPWTFTFT